MTDDELRAFIEANYGPVQKISDMLWAVKIAKAAIALEREACAKIAEQTYEGGAPYGEDGDSGFDFYGENSAAAIRARTTG